MSSSTRLFSYLRWLCLAMIIFVNTPPSQGASRLCGKHLSQALDLICENGFATKTKKSIEPMDYATDFYTEDEDTPSALEQVPFLAKFASNSLTKTRRRRHGIVHECCDKPCTYFELKSYCR